MNATIKGNKNGTSMPESLSTKLNRLTEKAKCDPEFKFKTLGHLLNEEMLIRAFNSLKKNAAAGVDGVTARDYERNLATNIKDLHIRLRENQYRSQPLRRTYIGKENGERRPLSIPALEDKIVQRAVVEILGRIYEVDFLDCSYGYRPKRSAHDAINLIREKITLENVSYVLDADIKDYFGSIVRRQLMTILEKRIADKVILRFIGKWLKAGVIEDGQLLLSEEGTYQGSIISPLLANIYLHEVLDEWVEKVVKPRANGKVFLCRYADDFVVCFQNMTDAKKFHEVLPKRCAKHGLTLHPEKTRLIKFGRYAKRNQRKGKPETFQFLGFTIYCAMTRKKKFNVKLKTAAKRLKRSLAKTEKWCKKNRHLPLSLQQKKLTEMILGHYQYYGRSSNMKSLQNFYYAVRRSWHKWLGRRSNNGYMRWDSFLKLEKRYPLPKPRITEQIKGQQLNF